MISIYNQVPGEFRLVAVILTILVLTYFVNRMITFAINRIANSRIARGRLDETIFKFVNRIVSVIIYIIGFGVALTKIPELKTLGQSMLAGAGILTIIGGMASQQVLGNIVSGFMIIFFRPFRIGDKITIADKYTGFVEDITLRETIIRDLENNRVIVPNSQMSTQVVINANHTNNRVCKFIEIGVAYSSDLDLAMSVMAEEIEKHPLLIDARSKTQMNEGQPKVVVKVVLLGDSSVILKAWAWANNSSDGFDLQCDSLANIKRRFDEEGIEIPFPQTTVSFAQAETPNMGNH